MADRTNRDSRLNTVIQHMEILFDRTNRDSRRNTVIRHMEILFDRTNRDSRRNIVIRHTEIRLWLTVQIEIPESVFIVASRQAQARR